MLRILIAAAIAAPLVAAASIAKDEKPAKPPAVIHAAKACTADGAFGRDFAESNGYGHLDSTADDGWAPFEHLTIAGREITAEASFRGTGTSDEEDRALAGKFRKAFEKAVEDKGKFPEHETHGDGMALHGRKDGGLVFTIWQEDDRVLAKCMDQGD